MARYVKAQAGEKNSVVYIDENGNRFLCSGGNRNLRNNNPGNLRPGKVSRRNGQIGTAGGFAIFPDIRTGRKALQDSLKNVHGDKDLEKMIGIYAPKGENKTDNYLRFLRKKTGVFDKKKIKNFSATEFEKLWKAIESMEGKQKPTVKSVRPMESKRCPVGQHWVQSHPLTIPPSKSKPESGMTTRRAHCALNPSGSRVKKA